MAKNTLDITLVGWNFSHINQLSSIFKDEKYLYNCDDYLPNHYEQSHVEEWIHKIITKSKDTKHFAILKNNIVAGGINISFKQGIWKLNAEISYFVAKEFRNKGVVTQAIKQVITYIFDNYSNIKRIIALTYNDNIAARKPLEKNHFIHEATLNDYLIKDDTIKDCYIYSLLRTNIG